MAAPILTLLSDYGLEDEFVGVCHGVIARICPQARIVDISHGIARGDALAGARALLDALPFMPAGVHVAIVDPGVGSERRALAVSVADGRVLVGPDNGVLWPAAASCGGVLEAVEISRSQFRLEPVSATFHGRDVFCPVAAHLAAGASLADAGERVEPGSLVALELPAAEVRDGALLAVVVGVDHFGNVQLGAAADDLSILADRPGDALELHPRSGGSHRARLGRTFADVPPGELVVYEDSARRLAIAARGDSAAARLALTPGDQLRLTVAGEVDRPRDD